MFCKEKKTGFMNWSKLKEKFPRVHDDLRETFKDKLEMDSRILIETYIESKGMIVGLTFIPQLNKIEESLKTSNYA
jgi:hypothetical protein